jgi:hypothetical protein
MGYLSGAIKHITTQLRLRGGVESRVITGSYTVDRFTAQLLDLDGGLANRNVDLPAEGASAGLWFTIKNQGSTNNLVVRDDTPATVATLTPGQWAVVACDGTTWRVKAT